MTNPSQRSVEYLRKQGYTVANVEKFNSFTNRRNDLFGFIDLVAIKTGIKGVLGVQTTSLANISTRVKKAKNLVEYYQWLNAGNRIEFHGWAKKKVDNRMLWKVKIIEGDL